MPGLEITLTDAAGATQRTTSDGQGRFTFDGVTPPYTLRADNAGATSMVVGLTRPDPILVDEAATVAASGRQAASLTMNLVKTSPALTLGALTSLVTQDRRFYAPNALLFPPHTPAPPYELVGPATFLGSLLEVLGSTTYAFAVLEMTIQNNVPATYGRFGEVAFVAEAGKSVDVTMPYTATSTGALHGSFALPAEAISYSRTLAAVTPLGNTFTLALNSNQGGGLTTQNLDFLTPNLAGVTLIVTADARKGFTTGPLLRVTRPVPANAEGIVLTFAPSFLVSSPLDGATGVALRPRIDFQGLGDDASYVITLRPRSEFDTTSRTVTLTTPETSFALPADLSPNVAYDLTISARSGVGIDGLQEFRATAYRVPKSEVRSVTITSQLTTGS